jgi:hypothetical protein
MTSFCLILPCSSGESETNRLNCAAAPLLLNATRHLFHDLASEVIVYMVLVTLRLMTQQCCTGRPMVVIYDIFLLTTLGKSKSVVDFYDSNLINSL